MEQSSIRQPIPEFAKVFTDFVHQKLGNLGCFVIEEASEEAFGCQTSAYFIEKFGPSGALRRQSPHLVAISP
jgi:hypothetical protein